MSDREIMDALLAQIHGSKLLVEELRMTGSALRNVTQELGRFCDEMREFRSQVETRQGDSERNIRVLQSRQDDFARRLKPLEEAHQAAHSKSAR